MPQPRSKIPDDIYVGFVRSLFNDAQILILGAACQGLMALLVYRSSSQPIYLWLGAGLVLAGLVRYATALWARRGAVVTDKETARRWERIFLAGTIIQSLAAGAFSFTAIYWVPDPFGEVAAVAVFLSAGMTIVGRNYGSRPIVLVLSLGVILPICSAWMLKGDLNYFILGLMMAPFMIIVMQMAKTVRTVLFTAIAEERKATYLAQRFNRALNTMTSGLVMLDPEGKVVVANAEAAALMRVDDPQKLLGRTLRSLLLRGVAGGLLSRKDFQYAEAQLTRARRERKDRKVLLKLRNGSYYEFSAREGQDELGVVTFEEVTQRVKSEERIRYMARYDSLTALPNRAYFNEYLGELVASGDPERLCGIAIFDLDDFKSINDTLGHPVGDGLIVAVAEKLSAHAGPNMVVGRFGGDEFTMFFNLIDYPEAFDETMDRIFAELKGDLDIAGHSIRVQLSAGGVVSRAGDFNVDGMMVKADLALYNAKESGKNAWRLFEGTMDQAFRNRQIMKADLRQAVESGSLRVVYQPIVSMETMRIVSCEALCRWDHPEIGPISPSVFIPLAEEIGIVSEISTFMLNAATAECSKWPEQVGVSINLSAKDFRNHDILPKIENALAASGLSPRRLEIEVTETALLDDKAQTREHIERLKALGVRIALDDFGTGYSSLSYLHSLPLDKVKIDRSFLSDINCNQRSLELLKGVTDLSKRLGLTVAVEGVENFEQLKVLAIEVKPDLVQGFLFGSALTALGIETMSNMTWPFGQQISDSLSVEA